MQAQKRTTRGKPGTPRTLDAGSPHRSTGKTRGWGSDVDECPGPQINCSEAPTAHGTTAGTALSAGREKSFPSHLFSLLRCLPSTKIISADLACRYPAFGPQVALQISDGLIAKPWKTARVSPTPLPSCAWPDHSSTVRGPTRGTKPAS